MIDRLQIAIKTRTVRYGCPFPPCDAVHGTVPPPEDDEPDDRLYCNEIAVDVGGVCWGFNTDQPIIDHHFDRVEGNFPSASAAVLHLHERIEAWVRALPDTTPFVQIVMHQAPDFDALAAATLVEALIRQPLTGVDRAKLGLHENGWMAVGTGKNKRQIDWFKPALYLTGDRPWLFRIASVASLNDQCHPYLTPVHLRLPAVMEAGMERGRHMAGDGERRAFFEAVRTELAAGANPLTDVLLQGNAAYRYEFELLHRVPEAYEADLREALRVSVPVPCTRGFHAVYQKLQATPFLSADGRTPNAEHRLADSGDVAVDGLYLRDPQCLLFKTLARLDRRNSPSGRGFVFTAIAYSNVKQNAVNRSDYYFSLDPEAIVDAHLYPVWTLLQAAELRARRERGVPAQAGVRREFKDRQPGAEGHFLDPWFDGGSYLGTIVVTPGEGTVIGPAGTRKDLSDDPVARIVRDYLETSAFVSTVRVWDVPLSEAGALTNEPREFQIHNRPPAVPKEHFRCVHVLLRDGVELNEGMGDTLAGQLWRWVDGGVDETLSASWPDHTWYHAEAAGVWSRQGIALATTAGAAGFHDEALECVRTMAKISGGVKETELTTTKLGDMLDLAAKQRLAAQHQVCRLGARFFGAMELDEQIELLYDRQNSASMRKNLDSIHELQKHAGRVEIFIFAIYVVEFGHILTEGSHTVMPIETAAYVVLSLVVAAASFWRPRKTLEQKEHNHEEHEAATRRGFDAWPQVVCLVLVIGAGMYLSHAAHEKAHAQKQLEQQKRESGQVAAPAGEAGPH